MVSNDFFSNVNPMEAEKSLFPENVALAMAYVPWQKLTSIYEPEVALKIGTLFPELDKPFLAGGK